MKDKQRDDGKCCSDCGKWYPYDEGFYQFEKCGNKYYFAKCKWCQKIHRQLIESMKRDGQYEPKRQPKKAKKDNFDKINDMQKEAAANGMSYGQYVAAKYMQERKKMEES